MQDLATISPPAAAPHLAHAVAEQPDRRTSRHGRPVVHWGRRAADRQFLTMEAAFNRTGGLSSADEVVRLARGLHDQPVSELARWIVDRSIVAFDWQGMTLLPMFQFDLATMDRQPGLVPVLAELRSAYDDWELASWFARPNPWLGGRTPAESLTAEPAAVLDAARADRFVAKG